MIDLDSEMAVAISMVVLNVVEIIRAQSIRNELAQSRKRARAHSHAFANTHFSDPMRAAAGGGVLPPPSRGHRYSYHENPANRYEPDFSSLPRDHRFLSWKRDLRPPPARRADIEGHEAVRGHRRSFHYDDRKEYSYMGSLKRSAAAAAAGTGPGGVDISPASARRSFDPSIAHFEPCDR